MSTVGGRLQQHLPCQDELAAAKEGKKSVPGTCFSSRTQKHIPNTLLGTHTTKTKPKLNQFPTSEWLGIAPGSSFPTGQRKCSPLSYPEKATLKSSFSGFDHGNAVFLNRHGLIKQLLSFGRKEAGENRSLRVLWSLDLGIY